MEGKSELQVGPSELDLNKERLAVLKEEYQRLCYEIKKKELLHSSNHTKIQQQIRQQWTKIAELKKQKSELTLQLRLQDSESFANKGNKNIEKFHKLLDDMVKLEEQVKKQNEEVEIYNKQIEDVNKKVRQKQKEIIKANRNKDRILKHQKNISFLECRLNLSLKKYNQLLIANNALREDISSLLQTQAAFRKQYNNIKHLISMGKKTVAEIVHSATTSYQTGESVKFKLNLLTERTQVDQRKLEEKIKELQLLIEQDKHLKDFIEFKGRDRSLLNAVEEIEAKKEQILEQNLQEYQAHMASIQLAAGCKEVNRICKTFVQQEEANVNLFEKINNLNVEIEKLHEEVTSEREELEILSHQYKEQKRKDMAEKNEIDDITDKLRSEAYEIEKTADAKAGELEHVKSTVFKIYKYLDELSSHQVSFSVDETVTNDNILIYLEALERRVLDLVECQKFLDRKQMYYYCEE